MIELLAAWAVTKGQLNIAQFNGYGSVYNGVGAVDQVVKRSGKAPMVYRILVPWVVMMVESAVPAARKYRSTIYEAAKLMLVWGALSSVTLALGRERMLFIAALLAITHKYDYWDWAGEMLGLALALTGEWQFAAIGGFVAGMSRETAPLVVLTYGLATLDVRGSLLVAAATAAGLVLVRWWGGKADLYCGRFMIRQNLKDLRNVFANRPVFFGEIVIALVLSVLGGAAAVTAGTPTWPVPLVIIGAGWLLARAAETRVFASVLLWVSLAIIT